MADDDYTLPDSPPPALRRDPAPASPTIAVTNKPSLPAPTASSSLLRVASPSTPYTSTPAPSSSQYLRSNVTSSTVVAPGTTKSTASSASSRMSGNTTVVPASGSAINQHPPRAPSSSSSHSHGPPPSTHASVDRPRSTLTANELELELPSFEQDTSAIHHVGSNGHDEEDEDEMVVLSSGSGTDSDRPPIDAAAALVKRHSSAPTLTSQMRDEEDLTGSSSSSSSPHSLDGYFASERLDSPAPPIHPHPHDYEIPITASPSSEDEQPRVVQPKVPDSARARRLSEANISIRRKPVPTTSGLKPTFEESPDAPSTKADVMFSPLRETSMSVNSPEIGRRNSTPLGSRDSFPSLSNLSTPHVGASPAGSDPKTPMAANAFSRIYATPDTEAARSMLPPSSSPAAVRRAQHVLTTLRSTTKPRLKKGTPHPMYRGRQLVDTPRTETPVQDSSLDDDRGLESGETSSSNDLTTLHRGNTSLPSGGVVGHAGRSDRFDHVKLNSYLHQFNGTLTAENVQLTSALGEKTKENDKLRRELEKMKEMSRSVGFVGTSDEEEEEGEGSRVEEMLNGLVKGRQQHRQVVDGLVEASSKRVQELETVVEHLQAELEKQDRRLERSASSGEEEKEEHDDDLRAELEAKSTENEQLSSALEDARARVDELLSELERQEAEFADKNSELNKELCGIMEKQDRDLESARAQLREAKDEVEKLQIKLEEQDDDVAHELRQEVRRLEDQIVELERTVERKDVEMDDLEKKHDALIEAEAEARRQVAEQAENIQQIEEALDESAQQLVQNEDELDSLRQQLNAEKNVNSTLQAQISQLKLPKAKSPLANEVYNSNKDSIIASLEEELQVAQQENEDLKATLQKPSETVETIEVQELRIKTLEKHKHELEERVSSLKSQVSMSLGSATPRRVSSTPDRSTLFRSIIGLQTPKTPGQMLGNLTAWSPGSAGDETITPLYTQIQELLQLVEDLRAQLAVTNDDVDRKLDQLEAAGTGTIALARQLSQARARIAQLEAELERLLGANGTLQRVRTRLMTVTCPGCEISFDANKIVQLRLEKSGLTFAESESSPQVSESLRSALAGVNAKLGALETENAVLLDSSSRVRELAADKSSMSKQLSSLQKDFAQARSEMVELELELSNEKTRLRTMANEQALLRTAKAALETQLNATEAELRFLKSSSSSDPTELSRLRSDKSKLLAERASLLSQLASIDSQTHRNSTSLNASSSAHSSIQLQLEAEIARLKVLLDEKDQASRAWRDERGDILRGVAGLQADLQKVRQDAISLGLDLEAVRRERDDLGRRHEGARELEQQKRRVEMLEKKIREHACGQTSEATSSLVELKARHAREAKGLLVMIKHLKQRVGREVSFRNDMAYQKGYLQATIREKQATIDLVMSQLGLPSISNSSSSFSSAKRSFKSTVLMIIALNRMRRASEEWREANRGKLKLRNEAYPATRGKPFVPVTA